MASSLNLIGAQRLVRKNCADCKAYVEVPRQHLIDVGIPPEEVESVKIMRGTGCRTCNNTGYKGRIAVYEIMIFNEELKEFVLNGAAARLGEIGDECLLWTFRYEDKFTGATVLFLNRDNSLVRVTQYPPASDVKVGY